MILIGSHCNGVGKASSCMRQHRPVFNCDMVGTFNIRLKGPVTNLGLPSLVKPDGTGQYWLAHFRHLTGDRMGWIYRWPGSKQDSSVLEVITRFPLPDSFKSGEIAVQLVPKWDACKRDAWAKEQYWFQTFDWSPKKRADSQFVLSKFVGEFQWPGLRVLDVGAHYGFFSVALSKLGAGVVAFEPDGRALQNSRIICGNIEGTDVQCVGSDPGGKFDIILYLSVHHQIDPDYAQLSATLAGYRERTSKGVVLELIRPPMFGSKAGNVDDIVGQKPLVTYQHNVRGERSIYILR